MNIKHLRSSTCTSTKLSNSLDYI